MEPVALLNVSRTYLRVPFASPTKRFPDPESSTGLLRAVLDSGSGNLFVGDANGTLRYVRETFSSATGSIGGACAAGNTPCLGTPAQVLGGAIVDAPIVDGS